MPPIRRLAVALLLVQSVLPAAGALAEGPPCSDPQTLAEGLFSSGEVGALPARALYALDPDALDAGRLRAQVRLTLDGSAFELLRSGRPTLCFALVVEAEGDLPVVHQKRLDLDLSGAAGFDYGFSADLPETAAQLVVVVEEPASRRFGLVLAEDAGEPLPAPEADAVRLADAWYRVARSPDAATADGAPVVVRLIPPRREPVSGATRFDALVTTDAVDRVVFLLDGEEVGERRRRPFAERIPLAAPPRPQQLVAIAYGEDGGEMGRDTLEVNRRDVPFRVRIEAVDGEAVDGGPATGRLTVRGRVDVPTGATLEHTELYYNEELLDTSKSTAPTFTIATRAPAATDYLRLVAVLADGSSIDDVVLVANPGLLEEVEVNLVELYVVVTDGEGNTVGDLGPGDFQIVFEGRRHQPQSLAYADDVSLLVGLVVDTSGSMQLVMHDTRRAAAKFLGTTVLPQDRAFLVDFADRPRLLHPTTDDLPGLLLDLSKLQAEGSTAMYDAIVFAMGQFERAGGRKALVVLTDGDDYESSFGPKYTIDLARRAGVPIYIIGLGQLDILRRTYSKRELRNVTEDTGGHLTIVDTFEQLDAAYARIQAELRSQYTLTFQTDRDLSDEERRDLRVEVTRPGLEARTVVGTGSAR